MLWFLPLLALIVLVCLGSFIASGYGGALGGLILLFMRLGAFVTIPVALVLVVWNIIKLRPLRVVIFGCLFVAAPIFLLLTAEL
jgi:hypothetical protein